MTVANIYLLYPFHHNFSDRELAAPEDMPIAGWRHWFTRLSVAGFAIAVDHSYSFIPPIKAVLNPELFGRDRDELVASGLPDDATLDGIRRFMADGKPNDQSWRRHYEHRSLRLTWGAPSLWMRQPLTLEVIGGDEAIFYEFRIDWADVLLLPDHVGIVMLRVTAATESVDDIASMARHIKKIIYRRRLTVNVPVIRLPDGNATNWAAILDSLLRNLRRDHTSQATLLSYSEYSGTQGVNWRLAAIVPADESKQLSSFSSALEEGAFCISVGRGPSSLENLPTGELREAIRAGSTLQPWDSWLALYNYENLIFAVDVRNPRLTREFHAHCENFENEYLIIFAFAIAQRTALDLLSGEIASIPSRTTDALAHLDALELHLIRFNTTMWFDQIGTTPIGQPLYTMLARCMGLTPLHRQVFSDAERLRRHLDGRQARRRTETTRRTETLLQFLTVVALPLTIYVTLFQARLLELPALKHFGPDGTWIGMGVSAVVLSVIWWLLKMRRRGQQDEF